MDELQDMVWEPVISILLDTRSWQPAIMWPSERRGGGKVFYGPKGNQEALSNHWGEGWGGGCTTFFKIRNVHTVSWSSENETTN